MEINLPKCLNLEKRKFKATIKGKHSEATLIVKVHKNKVTIKAKLQ